MSVAHLALDVPVGTAFDYLAPGVSADDVGRLAVVPFGRRRMTGVIVGVSDKPTVAGVNLKPVTRVLRELPALPPDVLALAHFCADYYHHPLGQVLATLLPQRLRRTRPAARPPVSTWVLTDAGRAVTVETLPPRATLRRRLLALLQTQGRLDRDEAVAVSPGAPKALEAFVALGWAQQTRDTQRAENPTRGPLPQSAPKLNADQRAAVEAVRAAGHRFTPWLLMGVTGSGKTEVYLELLADTLARGRQALVLVPEINLTPQTEARFRARFPHVPMVSLHSHLAEGERLSHWLAAARGEARIVLGTRLAVFTPLPELGLIVVDEEHDLSFKQQDGLRYSARDVAVFRARQRDVPIVLGSATPALESWHNARSGRYRLLTLRERAVEAARHPAVRIIDLRRNRPTEGLTAPLILALKDRLRRGEQSLLFLNRRGFSPVLMCGGCGWLAECPRCASRLVVHLREARMRCHHCGHEEVIPRSCPTCGALELAPVGQGTQRIEDALARVIPEARVLRVDRDSTRRKHVLADMLDRVRTEQVDVLVGTQMLAKGHDFPKLTLVGVLNVDAGLYSADFRAAERLYAQLLQVAGRAGRACGHGEVLIQTAFPDHPLFAALQTGDYPAFADGLLAERERLGLPPFTFQAVLRAEAHDMETALRFLREAAAFAPAVPGVEVYDAVPALLPRKAGKARAQLMVESASRSALQKFLSAWVPLLRAQKMRPVRWALDVNPQET